MSIEAITGNFNNTTVGIAKMTWNGIDTGFLKNGLRMMFDQETLDFEVNCPQQFVGRIVNRFRYEIGAGLAEVSAAALAMGLGGAGGLITVGASTVAWPGAGSSVVTVIDNVQGSGLKGAILVGSGITLPVVKSPDGTTTTYVRNTDYLLEPGSGPIPGSIQIIAGSSLATAVASDPRFWLTYSYVQPGSLRVIPGRTYVFETPPCVITHIRPHTGKFIVSTIPKMMAKGTFGLLFEEGKYQINDFSATAIPVTGYTDPLGNAAPYGYIDFEQ